MTLPTEALLSSVSALILEALKAGEIEPPVKSTNPLWDYCVNDTVYEWKTARLGNRNEPSKRYSPTGRVARTEPEPDYGWRTVRTNPYPELTNEVISMSDADYGAIERRVAAYFEDQFLGTLGAVTTNRLDSEPETLTVEKLEALMVQMGLKEPPRPKWGTMWLDIPVVKGKGRWLFDLETCS